MTTRFKIIHDMINDMNPNQFIMLTETKASFIGKNKSFTLRLEDKHDCFIVQIMNRYVESVFEFLFDEQCEYTENLRAFFQFIKEIEFESAIDILNKNSQLYDNPMKVHFGKILIEGKEKRMENTDNEQR